MPNDTFPNTTSSIGELGRDDILDNLNLEDDNEETQEQEEQHTSSDKDTRESESEEEEEEIKLKTGKDDDEDDEEVTDEKLELTIPVKRKEILGKYPTLFKDFPYLERAYYREQQYTELYPTLDDAKEAAHKSQVFDQYEREILNGNTEQVLQVIKQNDPKAFARTIDNYLPTLAKVDERAYYHVIGNTIRTVLSHMVTEGNRLGEDGDPLKIAAQIVNQFTFGNTALTGPRNLVNDNPENNVEAESLKRDKVEFVKQKFTSAHQELVGKVQNTLKSTIDAHIDPRTSMSDYVRKNATKDAYAELEDMMGQDSRFRSIMDKLWERAFENNFSQKSLDSIRSAYLSKAKVLLPTVIKKARNEALKGHRAKTESKEDKRGPLPQGRSTASTPSANKSGNKTVPSGMSTLDFLMQD